jgi:cytochrome c-type biogenesis protein CcmH
MSAKLILFVLLALMISVAAVVLAVFPLFRRVVSREASKQEVNLQVLRDQLQEVEADLAAGTLSQIQFDEAKQDIARRLLEEIPADNLLSWEQSSQESKRGVQSNPPLPLPSTRRLATGLSIAVPVISFALYLWLGNPLAMLQDGMMVAAGGEEKVQQEGDAGKRAITPEKVQAMIQGLKEQAEKSPQDGRAWMMLARAYSFVGKFSEAVEAYQHAMPLNPGDADLLADYADALAIVQNRTLGPEPMKLIREALKIDPENMKALALAATEAFIRKDYATAVSLWRKAVPSAAKHDPALVAQLLEDIREANQLGGGKLISEKDLAALDHAPSGLNGLAVAKSAQSKPAEQDQPKQSSGVSISGRVTLAPALKAQAHPEDMVYIFAKAEAGPPMPLAVMRMKVKDLPAEFTLDESMAMMPQLKLSNFPKVVVGARISRSGNAIPSSGDLQGLVKSVTPGSQGISIEISERLP